MSKLTALALTLALAVTLAAPAALMAQDRKTDPPQKGYAGWYCPAPRFQVFEADRPYGGLVMMDTQTGQSWQRVVVNSKDGIRVLWMPIPMKGPQAGESIIWD